MPLSVKLNVGCGRDIREGYVNIDGSDLPGIDFRVDLDDCAETPLPLPDDHFQELELSHVLEHLRNPLPLMQELYRIAAPGAKLNVKVPHASHDDAWIDPTHVRAVTPQTFAYFGQPKYVDFDYGYTGDWRVESCDVLVLRDVFDKTGRDKVREAVFLYRNVAKEIVVELIAEKPARARDASLDPPIGYRIIPA
jgi:SAM-dependent methyltransferase